MACLIYLLILICLLGDINNLNVKEILKIYSIEKKYIQITKMSDVYHSALSCYVSDCTYAKHLSKVKSTVCVLTLANVVHTLHTYNSVNNLL